MDFFSPQWSFLVLGPALIATGAIRWAAARRLVPQARTYLLLGAIFTAVAMWLWWMRPTLI